MNNYMESITSSLDGNRGSVRRIAQSEDTEFSQQSILNVMDKFVKTVNRMDETILVPCRLMDQHVDDERDPSKNVKSINTPIVNQMFQHADLFHIYSMINGVKDNLLWGQIQESTTGKDTQVKGHIRRPSSISEASTNSISTLSDTDSESGSNDSGIEEPVEKEEKVQKIAQDFRIHLHNLTKSLSQMTEAAQYLTWRYQYDIGGPI